jgi:hypothetical protein
MDTKIFPTNANEFSRFQEYHEHRRHRCDSSARIRQKPPTSTRRQSPSWSDESATSASFYLNDPNRQEFNANIHWIMESANHRETDGGE